MRIVTDTIDNLHYKYNDSLVHQIKISNTISSLCIVGKENNEIRNQILNIRNIGENVTEIEDYCCYRCNNLTSVKNGDKINRIMNYSFCDCTNLTSFPAVTEGNTKIDEIGTCAFSGTGFKKLKIRFKGGDEKNTTLISCFSNCNNLEEVQILDVPYIKDYMFSNCRRLSKVIIPDSYTWKSNYSFMNCTNLTSFGFTPNFVNGIGDGYFMGCSKLEKADMDCINSTTHGEYSAGVGNDAFSGCNLLLSFKSSPLATSFSSFGSNMLRGSYIKEVHFTGIPTETFQSDNTWRNGFGIGHDCDFYSSDGTLFRFMWNSNITVNDTDYPNFYSDNTLYPANQFPVGGYAWMECDSMNSYSTWFNRITTQSAQQHVPMIMFYSGGAGCDPCKQFKKVCYGPGKDKCNKFFDSKKYILQYIDVFGLDSDAVSRSVKEFFGITSLTPPYLGIYWKDMNNVDNKTGVSISTEFKPKSDPSHTEQKFIDYIANTLAGWGYQD